MGEDDFARRLRGLEQPTRPRPGFADELFERLVTELQQTPGPTAGTPPDLQPAVPSLSDDTRERPRRSQAWIAVAAALLAVVVVGGPVLLLRSADEGRLGRPVPVSSTIPEEGLGLGIEPGRPEGITLGGGVEGYYVLYLPRGYHGTEPIPVVVSLTGESGGHAGGMGMWGTDFADERGFAIVSLAPAGGVWAFATSETEATALADDRFGGAPPYGDTDVRVVRAVLDDLAQRIVIDPDRLYLSGQDDGGLMAIRLGCELGGTVAAVVTYPNALFLPAECPLGRSFSMLGIGPIDGSASTVFPPDAARASLEAWAVRSGCAERHESSPAPGVTTVHFDGCSGGIEYTIHLASEAAPEPWADRRTVMWEFLDTHPHP